MTEYRDQYCKKHDQWYADFLEWCPICKGEEMAVEPKQIVVGEVDPFRGEVDPFS